LTGLGKVLSPLNITLTHKAHRAKFLSRIYLIFRFFFFGKVVVVTRWGQRQSSGDPAAAPTAELQRPAVAAKAMVVVGLVAAGAPVVVGGCNF